MKLTYATLTLSLALCATNALANPSDELISRLKNVKSYEAEFTQTITDDSGKTLTVTEGTLEVDKPSKFRWKSMSPDQVLVVADGKYIWTYDIELDQVIQNEQKTTLGQSPAALLAGSNIDLNHDYDIVIISNAECLSNLEVCYKLTPKDEKSNFKVIKIGFNGNEVKSIEMNDALDQKVKTEFNRVKLNVPMDKALFHFTPPKGVDVIKGTE